MNRDPPETRRHHGEFLMMKTTTTPKGEPRKSGQKVETTGIYEVLHHPNHRPRHRLTLRKGQAFPMCQHCETSLFMLMHAAPLPGDDPDF
jgi:hypothetical protein